MSCHASYGATDFAAERLGLVERLRGSGIRDEGVLNALLDTPRHLFVPSELVTKAYLDVPLPIGEQQTISQPWVVARMTEYLMASSPRKVLEVGTGSGYQAAVLARLVDEVFTIERIECLAEGARRVWQIFGLKNIVAAHADGYSGWPSEAPFDAIMVTAGASQVPAPLYEQLAEGGRLVMPVGDFAQRLLVSDMTNGAPSDDYREGVRFVPLLHGLKKEAH